MNFLKNIIYFVLLLLIVFFCFINKQDVTIHLIPKKIDIELPIFIMIIFIGFLGWLLAKISNITQKLKYIFEIRNLNSQLSKSKEELAKYQSMDLVNDYKTK